MADIKITLLDLLAAAGIDGADVVPVVDVDDNTQAASGTTKKTTILDLVTFIHDNLIARIQDIGVNIEFITEKVYNTATAPETGNVVFDQTDAVLGVVQKIYHDHSVAPTFTGVPDVQLVGDGVYFTNELNIIYAEWTQADRVEYWIVQEQ